MDRKTIAITTLALYLAIVIVVMFIAQRFDLQIFFVLTLIGILVIAELLRYRYVTPRYQRWIGYLIGAGIVLFGAIVVMKIAEILRL